MSLLPTNARTLAALLVASAMLAGCSTTTTQSFNVVKNSRVESSYIAVGADFGRFNRLTAEDMGIFFPAEAAPPPGRAFMAGFIPGH